MSLQLIQSGDPAFQYELFNPPPSPPFTYPIIVPNDTYQESLRITGSIQGFYYDVSRDVYSAFFSTHWIFFPSYRYIRVDFSPETGVEVSRENDFFGGAIGFAWTKGYTSSDWKKIYVQRIFSPTNYIFVVDPLSPLPVAPTPATALVAPSDVDNKNMDSFAFNRDQTIIAFSNGINPVLERYDYSTGTNIGAMRFPGQVILGITSESNEILWALQNDDLGGSVVVKANFLTRQTQLYSYLPASTTGTDITTAIAFDPLRKSLAIFRQRPDNPVTGAATHILDIYKPTIDATTLTAPVPVTELKPNSRVTLVAHVLDEKGTGAGGKSIKVTKTNPDSNLKQPVTQTRSNGSIVIPYDSPGPLATDTISLEVTV